MARICPGLLLWMTMATLASRGVQAWGSKKVTREFQDIPASYVYVQQALWFAMKEYNEASRDTYVYKVTNILRSQEQVTDSLDYLLEVKIERTMCKKISGTTDNCLIQEDPKMQKMFYCTFIVASKPWKFELKMLKKECSPI
ncbi:unnamed protein product [Rangifer tarandus platyrhynchus]|uniref:Uncharacterized protein n=3 Tax=Rangifer tarandus platyrhynchus TaxID=3082113 RepID=A0AC59Y868_RANTA|nr:unnamed protein product [Rangifer tarandus platyrhynchus]CAI9713294.1 unnamed protein product [Rangifer tarandus platyrhynchus]